MKIDFVNECIIYFKLRAQSAKIVLIFILFDREKKQSDNIKKSVIIADNTAIVCAAIVYLHKVEINFF